MLQSHNMLAAVLTNEGLVDDERIGEVNKVEKSNGFLRIVNILVNSSDSLKTVNRSFNRKNKQDAIFDTNNNVDAPVVLAISEAIRSMSQPN